MPNEDPVRQRSERKSDIAQPGASQTVHSLVLALLIEQLHPYSCGCMACGTLLTCVTSLSQNAQQRCSLRKALSASQQSKQDYHNLPPPVQFKMVSMCLEKPICTPPCLSEVSPALPLKRFQCSSDYDGPLSSFQGRSSSASSFHISLLQVINGVMSWLCARRSCLKPLNTSDLPRSKPLVMVVLPTSLSAW